MKKNNLLPNLEQYREIFLLDLQKSDQTRYNYKKTLDLLLNNFKKNYYLYSTSKGDVLNFKAYLLTKYNKGSVNRFIGYFRTIYFQFWDTYGKKIYNLDPSWFFTKGNIFKDTMFSKRELNKDPIKNNIILSDEQFNRLILTIRKMNIKNPEQLADLVMVYRYLGLRRNEAFLLEKESVQDNYVIINGQKTGELRSVPLFSEVAEILKRRKAISKDYLFDYAPNTLFVHFKQAIELTGLSKKINLHTLRKNFCSSLIKNGVPIKEVSEFLGHDSIKTTESWYWLPSKNNYDKWININKTKKEDDIIWNIK